MSASGFTIQDVDPDKVWINISYGKTVRAAVLTACGNIYRGVYKLEDEMIGTVKKMVEYAIEGENIRFYILEKVEEDK